MESACCPSCGATTEHLQVCLRTWHRFNAHFEDGVLIYGEPGPTIDVDYEAESEVFCEACDWLGAENDLVPGPGVGSSKRK